MPNQPDANTKNQQDAVTGAPPSSGARRLLELLCQRKTITAEQSEQARRRMQRAGIPAEQALMELGSVSQEAIFRGLAELTGLEFVHLHDQKIQEEAIRKVPVKITLHYRLLPIRLERGILTCAFSTPPGIRDRENLRVLLGVRIQPVIAIPADISRTMKTYYGLGAETVVQLRQDRTYKAASNALYDDAQTMIDEDEDGASIRFLVNQILREALEMQATDIHIEPFEESVHLRYRIDGMLREIPTPAGLRELHPAIVSRMKVMANLDIAEKRLPHDGRVRIRVGEEDFDLRVSILPTRFGETLNLRILSRESVFCNMRQLGLEPRYEEILTRLLEMPHGMILVTGPTGSGKSTTLYAALDKTDKKHRKVITVEDPIEYQVPGISQIQVRDSIGLTFARGLRSILRHDPDIILVGEIRDGETAEIAIRSAMTGHLVLSTLHTNDSVGAVNRLIDLEVEPFLVASTLRASLAQRLVRRICPHCKEPDTDIPEKVLREMMDFLECDMDELHAFKGRGCVECDYTGFRGRMAIFEFFLMNEELEDMVSRHAKGAELRAAARRSGMQTLRQDGWLKVQQGGTSIQEILRVTTAFDIHF